MTWFLIITITISLASGFLLARPLVSNHKKYKLLNAKLLECEANYLRDKLNEIQKSFHRQYINKHQYNATYQSCARELIHTNKQLKQSIKEQGLTTKLATTKFATPEKLARIIPVLSFMLLFSTTVVLAYFYLGRANFPDMPIAGREGEIAAANTANARAKLILKMVGNLEQKLKTSHKNNATSWQKLARSYVILNNKQKQVFAFEGWAKADKKNPQPILLGARVVRELAGKKQTKQTYSMMQRALKIDEDNTEALLLSAMFLYKNPNVARKAGTIKTKLNKVLASFEKGTPSYNNMRSKIKAIFKNIKLQ